MSAIISQLLAWSNKHNGSKNLSAEKTKDADSLDNPAQD